MPHVFQTLKMVNPIHIGLFEGALTGGVQKGHGVIYFCLVNAIDLNF